MNVETTTSKLTHEIGVPDDGTRGALHEKSLFETTLVAGLNRDVLVGDLLVREVEADLLKVEKDGEEVARIHHGYSHSTIIVFADIPVTRQLLRENYINDDISLEEDAELYPEVKPVAVWAKKIREWGEDDVVNALTRWRVVTMGTNAKSGAEWFHAVYNAKLLK